MANEKTRKDTPRAAAIYCRISDDRTGEAAGVRRQEDDARKLARQLGWSVAQVYIDNDVSAFRGKVRPEYQRLLADLRAGTVDAVLAWHTDRLHRSLRELEDFIDVIETAHAPVQTVQAGPLDLTTASGRQNARILAAVARGESERMGDRIRRKHQELAELGQLNGGGHRPFGYEQDRLAIRPSEGRLIREAARRVLSSDSMTGIVRDWNAAGILTTGGKVWDVSGLRTILVSARISGRREHHGRIVGPAVWKRIIRPEDSDRLRAMLGPSRGRRPGPPTRFLLTGLLRCGRCGMALAGSRAPTRVAERATAGKWATLAYACSRHARNRPIACGRLRVRATALEEMVAEMLFAAVDSGELAERIAERKHGDKRATALDTVAVLEEDLQRLAADFGEGRVPYAEWAVARGPLERRLAEATRRLDVERGTLPLNGYTANAGVLRKAWGSLSLDRKRAILAVVFDHITIKPANPVLARNKFDPDRVKVVWRF